MQTPASDKDLPFAELDTLYRRLFSAIDVENRQVVLKILGLLIFQPQGFNRPFSEVDLIVSVLSLEPGQIEFYLADLASILERKVGNTTDDNDEIRITHASLSDFFLDPHRSKEFHINESAFYAELALIYSDHLTQIDTTPSQCTYSDRLIILLIVLKTISRYLRC